MQRIAFASELAGQIWIAFPVREIRSLHGPVTVGGEAAVRQRVSQAVADGCFQFGARREVPAAVPWIAPCSVLCPMPCRHTQFGVISVGDRPPTCREGLLNDMWRIYFVDVRAG